MGIMGRLGSVINSYFNDFEKETAGRLRSTGDPDLDAAYEELDDYLGRKNERAKSGGENANRHSWRDPEEAGAFSRSGAELPPEELRADFETLCVPFGADNEACKSAYKKLLKIHHPDRHAGHEGNFKKATEKSAKINAAWDRIEKWRQKK